MIASRPAEFRSNISTAFGEISAGGLDGNPRERPRFERESQFMRVVARYCTLFLLTLSSPAWGDGELVPMPAEWGVTLVFDESAAALAQNDIRVAVEQALGAPVLLEPSPERPTLRVSLAGDGVLVLTYQRSASTLERRLPNPQSSEQIPLLVGLAAVNLFRNQAADLMPKPEPPSAPEAAPAEPRALPAAVEPPEPAPEIEKRDAPKQFRNWFGIHLGLDLALMTTSNACDPAAREKDGFVCFNPDGSTYTGTPSSGAAGSIRGGLNAATVPLLISFEHIFGSFGVEARAGYAFNGGPKPQNGSAFLPLRAELRGKFWPLGTNAPAFDFRPYLYLGAGLAQVDATTHSSIVDCSGLQEPQFMNCVAAENPTEAQQFGGTLRTTMTVMQSLGLASFTAGAGTTFALADGHAIVLDLSFMLLVPATGFTMEPSIGYRIGL